MAVAQGFTAPGFDGVRDVFEQNFANGLEVGACFSAYHRGEKVVDLWGGIADQTTGRPWTENTIEVVFSTTKGVTAICAHKLAQEGKLDFDAPVAKYWPEFAQNGKADIPVSYIISHQAGLPWVDGTMTPEEAFAWDPVIRALEQQAPVWEPGNEHGYHATTYGWLVGEVIKRITGMSIGAYFRQAIAEPLQLDFWIGLPESEEPRVARLVGGIGVDENEIDEEMRKLVLQFMGPDTELGKALFAPGGALGGADVYNTRACHAAEIPAAGGIGDARSLARLYGACVSEVDGIRVLTPEEVKIASAQQTKGPNRILMGMDMQFGLGFIVPSSMITLGGPNSFGHFGAGGSVGWADPDAELGFGYVMNKMAMGLAGDTRCYDLVAACYAAVS
jgi:CubicO group peptidase (beta-lactamase class C family)